MFGLSPRAKEHLRALSDLCDPRQVQRRFLADLRALSADYVRSPAFLALMLKPMPKGVFIGIDELAGITTFLVSAAARNITGQVIVVDGGWTAQ